MQYQQKYSLFACLMTFVTTVSCSHIGDEKTGGDTLASLPLVANVSDEKDPITIDDMILMRDMGDVGRKGLVVSPDGKYAAFQMHRANLVNNDYEAAWYALPLTGLKQPIFLGDAGDPELFRAKLNGSWWIEDTPAWSLDSKWFLYRRMENGSAQIWRSSVDGKIQEQVTNNRSDVDAFRWSANGNQIFFETDMPTKERVAFLSSKAETGYWAGDPYFDPRNMNYQLQPYELIGGKPWLWVIDIDSMVERRATSVEIADYYDSNKVSVDEMVRITDRSEYIPGRPMTSNIRFSRNGSDVAFREAERDALYPDYKIGVTRASFDASLVYCENPACLGQIEDLWWAFENKEIVFIRREGADYKRQVIYSWNISNNSVRKIFEDGMLFLDSCSQSTDALVCFSTKPDKPLTIVGIDFANGVITELFDPNPEFNNFVLGSAERLEWANSYGIEAFAWLVKPADYEVGKRYPLVILQYSATSCFKGGVGDEYPAQLLASSGFMVLCFDHPAIWDLYKTLPSADEVEKERREDLYITRVSLASLEAAIILLDEQGLIDPEKVGITGLSEGAMTAYFALIHSNRFSAAIVASTGLNPINYFLLPGWNREFLSSIGFGRPGTVDGKNVSLISLGVNAEKVNAPLLIQTSDDEAIYGMYDDVTLSELGKPVDKYVFKDEYHIKWHPRNRRAVAERGLDWFRFWLQDKEDADPAKAEQYERWRKLRTMHEVNLQKPDTIH